MMALERLRDILSDLKWTDEIAIDVIHQELNDHFKITKKAVEHWFIRGIPGEHIFNISSIFGVDAGWLGGQSHMTKKKAIRLNGRYDRETKIRLVVPVPFKKATRKKST